MTSIIVVIGLAVMALAAMATRWALLALLRRNSVS